MRNNKVRRYGYDRRKQKQKQILSIAVTVVLVVAAGIAGWFVYPSAYEFFTRKPEASAEQSSASSDSSAVSEAVSSNPETSSPDETATDYEYRYAFVPASILAGDGVDDYFAQLRGGGYDGVTLELKNDQGIVLYRSAAAASYAAQAVSPTPYDLAQTVAAAKRAGLAVSGQLYAFRDPTAARLMYASAVKYNYTEINWIDNSQAAGGKPWLNPNNSAAQEYILALAKEAAQAGVTEIALAGVQFPTGYSLDLATFSAKGVTVDKSAVLAAFFKKAAAAMQDYGAHISFALDMTGLLGTDSIRYGNNVAEIITASGQVLLDIAPAQFSSAFVYGDLTLASPALDPYNTVRATLSLAELPEAHYFCRVQAYTAETLPQTSNKPYTDEDIQAQIRAAETFEINDFVLYHPLGQYQPIR